MHVSGSLQFLSANPGPGYLQYLFWSDFTSLPVIRFDNSLGPLYWPFLDYVGLSRCDACHMADDETMLQF